MPPNAPEKITESLEKCSIFVERIQTEKDLEVADHVTDHKADQHEAGDGNDPFFSD